MNFLCTVGQQETKVFLSKRLAEKRVPHAQMIVGPTGRGGLALGLDLAFSLLYENVPPSIEKALEHPDLHFVFPVTTSAEVKTKPRCLDYLPLWRKFISKDCYVKLSDWLYSMGSENKQGNIGVDEAEQIFKSLALKPFLGKNKVCVLWGLDRLQAAASNKLLKLIEEPPKNTFFLFIVQEKENLLPTIQSRCQEIRLPPLQEEDIKKALVKLNLDEHLLAEIVQRAEGDLCWAKQQVSKIDQEANLEKLLIACLRLAFRAAINPAISVELMQWANELAQMGSTEQKAFLRYGLGFIRQALFHSYNSPELVNFRSNNNFSLDKFAPYVHSQNAVELITLFDNSIYSLKRNANAKVLFSDFCIQLTRLLSRKES